MGPMNLRGEGETADYVNSGSWGRKAIKDWMSAYSTGCADFKRMVDENYAKVEAYFGKE